MAACVFFLMGLLSDRYFRRPDIPLIPVKYRKGDAQSDRPIIIDKVTGLIIRTFTLTSGKARERCNLTSASEALMLTCANLRSGRSYNKEVNSEKGTESISIWFNTDSSNIGSKVSLPDNPNKSRMSP